MGSRVRLGLKLILIVMMVMSLMLVVRFRVRASSSLLFRMLSGESYGWPPEKLCLHVAYVDFDGGAAIEAQDVFLEVHPVLLDAFHSPPEGTTDRLLTLARG